MDRKEIKTPAYVIDEKKLRDNLKILEYVQQEADCHILLAQKAFSAFCVYPLIGSYLSGTTASGLYEARLGKEEMNKEWKSLNSDVSLGMGVVCNALSKPLCVLAENTGLNGETVVDKVAEGVKTNPAFGFNADTEEYGDLIKSGVIDAANSMKTAIENAVSVVSTVIMTETISCIIEDEEKK